ncbi:MAG: S26 family signal peptidase [Hyphomicrobiaceae bacterium]
MRRTALATTITVASTALACSPVPAPLIIWNATPSVPVGLYRVTARPLSIGALAVVSLPSHIRRLAAERGYLPASALLIKPIVGLPGDTVCRYGRLVTVNGRFAALAYDTDANQRQLPKWTGCHRLDDAQVVVISKRPDSFDSRYFGPLSRADIAGLAISLWVPTPAVTAYVDRQHAPGGRRSADNDLPTAL